MRLIVQPRCGYINIIDERLALTPKGRGNLFIVRAER